MGDTWGQKWVKISLLLLHPESHDSFSWEWISSSTVSHPLSESNCIFSDLRLEKIKMKYYKQQWNNHRYSVNQAAADFWKIFHISTESDCDVTHTSPQFDLFYLCLTFQENHSVVLISLCTALPTVSVFFKKLVSLSAAFNLAKFSLLLDVLRQRREFLPEQQNKVWSACCWSSMAGVVL